MTKQGKLLTKYKVPWFVVRLELTLALPWSLEINGSKNPNIEHQNVSCDVGLKHIKGAQNTFTWKSYSKNVGVIDTCHLCGIEAKALTKDVFSSSQQQQQHQHQQ
jgi:hypothetical protein